MAKKQEKGAAKETKSEFLRKALSKNPNLDYDQVLGKWAKAGHPGEISNALYYQVRAKLGIKTQWMWVKEPERGSALDQVYQLKITLVDIRPPIWRRIQVPDFTLGALHRVIQTVMGWDGGHMHQFIIDEECYGEAFLDDMDSDLDMNDEEGIRLSEIIAPSSKKFRFVYEYDFGDGWQHEILFEKTVAPEPKAKYPRCLEGERACPPDDVGGAWGYLEFLEVMANPKHAEYREMKEWVGGKFDPERFSVNAVNQDLWNSYLG